MNCPSVPESRFCRICVLSKIVGGWQLSALFTASTGTPITPYYTTNNSGTLNNEDRPNVVSGVNVNGGPQTPQEWFNVNALSPAPVGTFGDAGRNIINGPNLIDLDSSLVRYFKIKERATFSLRGQFYNTFNHPNFNYPNAQFGTAAFGTIVSAQDPRELEIAARLTF